MTEGRGGVRVDFRAEAREEALSIRLISMLLYPPHKVNGDLRADLLAGGWF